MRNGFKMGCRVQESTLQYHPNTVGVVLKGWFLKSSNHLVGNGITNHASNSDMFPNLVPLTTRSYIIRATRKPRNSPEFRSSSHSRHRRRPRTHQNVRSFNKHNSSSSPRGILPRKEVPVAFRLRTLRGYCPKMRYWRRGKYTRRAIRREPFIHSGFAWLNYPTSVLFDVATHSKNIT